MKKLTLTFLITISTLLINGCGGSSSGSNTNNSGIKTYNTYVTPTYPQYCSYAQGEIVINGSVVSGTVKLNSDTRIYVVSGTYISNTGSIEGGFATNGKSIAEFSGVIHGSTGQGTYLDDYGCSGTWSVSQK